MTLKTVRMSLLFDFYGQLLTERQREFFSLYYDHDLSLGEIAGQYGVSRQAVYDILRRSSQTLMDLEEKLELVARYEQQRRVLDTIQETLKDVAEALDTHPDEALRAKVQRALGDLDTLR